MGESNWLLFLLGGGSLGVVIQSLIAKVRTKHEKQIDKNELSEAMADALHKTLDLVQRYHKDVLDGYVERLRYSEKKIIEQGREKHEYRQVISKAYKCKLLETNTNFSCPVQSAEDERLNRKRYPCEQAGNVESKE